MGTLDTKPIHNLLSKEMDRKEFLVHIGGVMLAVIGVTGLIKQLADPFGKSSSSRPSPNSGYGSSAYGGTENSFTSKT